MPYVGPGEALNRFEVEVAALAAEMGAGPARQALIGTPATRWVLLKWPPGFVSVPHHHPRAEEAFYILSGRARFRFAGEAEVRDVGAGTLLLAPRGVQHTIGVLGREPLLFLASVTPNEDAPDETIEDPGAPGLNL